MHLYRYSSGVFLRTRQDGTQPEFTAFFMPPDNKGDYPNACMAVIRNRIKEEDPDATRQYKSLEQQSTSYLDPRGEDDFVTMQLHELRWLHAAEVPSALRTHAVVQRDTQPDKGQWFITEVADDFVPALENLIAVTLKHKARAAGSFNRALWARAIGISVVLVIAYLFLKR